MKIIHIPRRFDSSSWGGTEQVVLQTGLSQIKSGNKAHIYCPDSNNKNWEENIKGVPIKHLKYFYPFIGLSKNEKARLDKKGGNIFSFSLLWNLWNTPNVDILHLHTIKRIGGIGRLAAKRKKIPYVIQIHGGLYDVPETERGDMIKPISGAFEWGKALGFAVGSRKVIDEAAAIICLGTKEAELIAERHPKQKIVLTPNGVDVERFTLGNGTRFREKHGISSSAKVLVQVARIDHQKNQLLVVKSLQDILKKHKNCCVVFVGPITSQSYHDKLVELIKSNGLEKNVILTGAVDPFSNDLIDAYDAADVILMPSLHEPFGISILEGWAAGKPVVAANVGGIPGFATHGKNALLFKSNDKAEFVGFVLKVLQESIPGKIHPLGADGKAEVAAKYSWEKITSDILNLYKEVIDENSFRK